VIGNVEPDRAAMMSTRVELLLALAIVAIAGCGTPIVDDTYTFDDDAAARFSALVADGQLADAAALVQLPTRFYPSDDGLWVIASPGNSTDPEWSVAATPGTWASRFRNGTLKSTTLFVDDDSIDLECSYLVTGVMCDPLQMVVRIVPQNGRVSLVVNPIGERGNFVLD